MSNEKPHRLSLSLSLFHSTCAQNEIEQYLEKGRERERKECRERVSPVRCIDRQSKLSSLGECNEEISRNYATVFDSYR